MDSTTLLLVPFNDAVLIAMDLLYSARPHASLKGVLLDENGKPVAHRRLILRSDLFPVRSRANLNEWVRLPREHMTDALGRFEVPLPDPLPPSQSDLLSLSLARGEKETLLLTRDLTQDLTQASPEKELELRLSGLTSVALSIDEHQEGKPLLCHYLPLGVSGWRTIPQAFHALARGRGSFDLKLPAGRYIFAFETPGRFLQKEIIVSPGAGPMAMRLGFTEPRRVSGRLQDADGKPVVGAELQWVPMVQRGRRKRWRYRSPLADQLIFSRLRTGPLGAFEFFLPSGPGEHQLSVTWRKTAASTWHSPMLHRFRAGKGDILDLTLKLSTR